MKGTAYYFIIHSGNLDQTEREYTRWAFSKDFTSKEALRKHFSVGRQTVKAKEIYSCKQMAEKFSRRYIETYVLSDIARYQPELRNRQEQK